MGGNAVSVAIVEVMVWVGDGGVGYSSDMVCTLSVQD